MRQRAERCQQVPYATCKRGPERKNVQDVQDVQAGCKP